MFVGRHASSMHVFMYVYMCALTYICRNVSIFMEVDILEQLCMCVHVYILMFT